MQFQDLTSAEQVLLISVGLGTLLLTALVIICIVWKRCWLYGFLWDDGKKKKDGLDDIICIRYPTDIYPSSVGIYRENILRSPAEDELARIFNVSPVKRDSTYSSMSENSNHSNTNSVYELAASPRHSSATSTPVTDTPDSPDSSSHLITTGIRRHSSPTNTNNNNNNNNTVTVLEEEEGEDDDEDDEGQGRHGLTSKQTTDKTENNDSTTTIRQPFFTFGLKYEERSGAVHLEFLEARNLPWRHYLNQPCDVFFTMEIEPKKFGNRKLSIGGGGGGTKGDMMRYRFITKTLRKAPDISDFNEKFLAQLSKANLKDYRIRFTGFDQDRFGNPTELGSTTLTFNDFRDFTKHQLILSCSLKEPIIKRGDLLLGLCYLPTAERISVNVMKVINMNPYFSYGTITKQSICYVRVFLLRSDSGKVLKRKKTTYQRLASSPNSDLQQQPIFNETLVFDMPPSELLHTVLLVMVCLTDRLSGSSNTSSGGGDLTPSQGNLATKRHSTPTEHHLRPPTSSDANRHHRHSVDDAIFHYGDNNRRLSDIQYQNERRSSDEVNRQPSAEANRDSTTRSRDHVVGKVAFGFGVRNTSAKAHWDKMIKAPRTIASEWHNLV